MFCTTVSKQKFWSIPLVILFTFPVVSHAVEKLGFNWHLETILGRDDNTYRTVDQLAASDTTVYIKPKVAWLSRYNKHKFDITYQGDYGSYSDQHELNYDDHDLKAHALLDHSYRLNTEYTLSYDWNHDHPGETETLYIPNEKLNKWEHGHATAKIFYGRNDSHGQLVGQLAYHKRHHSNSDQEFRDYARLDTIATFYYRVAPKIRLLFEARLEEHDYQKIDGFGISQTNKDSRYLAGISWKATAKTAGIFKIGYRDKNYDNDQFGDLSGLALWLDTEWRPNSYTLFTLRAIQETRESAQQNRNGYVRQYAKAHVKHRVTPLTQLFTEVQYGQDKFDNSLYRKDDRWNLLLGINYSLFHWFDLAAEYRHEKRDSNQDAYDFRANVFMLTASLKLSN
jgi:hypothetical protein